MIQENENMSAVDDVNKTVKDYVITQTEIEVPALQQMFSLSYSQVKTIVDELKAEHKIEFKSGVTYEVLSPDQCKANIYHPKDEKEKLCLEALWLFIKNGDNCISTSHVQRRISVGYATAASMIDWLEESGLISPLPERKILISREQFIGRFGNPDETPITLAGEVKQSSEGPVLFKHVVNVSDANNNSDDDNDFDDFFDDDDDDDEEEEPDDEKTERISEEMRRELDRISEEFKKRRTGDDDDDDDDDGDDDDDDDDDDDIIDSSNIHVGLKMTLLNCFDLMSTENSGKENYVLNVEDDLCFEFKFVDDGSKLRISDSGYAVKRATASERRIKNILKGFKNVSMEGNEIVVTSDDPNTLLRSMMILYAAVDAAIKLK